MSRPKLLDVNALIALFDAGHANHGAAHRWFGIEKRKGWRTCPITENGLLRILSNPNYQGGPLAIGELATKLENSKAGGDHAFWPDSFSMSEWISKSGLSVASSKMTDAYLLKLAAEQGGTMATFDLRITIGLIGSKEAEILEHIPV